MRTYTDESEMRAEIARLRADNAALNDAWQGDIELLHETSRERDELRARVAELEAALDAAYAWWITVPKTVNVMQPPWVARAHAVLGGKEATNEA